MSVRLFLPVMFACVCVCMCAMKGTYIHTYVCAAVLTCDVVMCLCVCAKKGMYVHAPVCATVLTRVEDRLSSVSSLAQAPSSSSEIVSSIEPGDRHLS